MSGSAYDFGKMAAELQRDDPSNGRRATTGTAFRDYDPISPNDAKSEHLSVVDAAAAAQKAGKDPLEAALVELDSAGKLNVSKTADGAENAAIKEYRNRRSLDEKAGMPRSRYLLVEGTAKSNRMAEEIEKQDRADGIVTGDSRKVVLFGGSTTLSAGQRVDASGAFREMEGGASGKVLAFTDTPNQKGQPSLFVKFSLDVNPGELPRIVTVPVMTPDDLRNGLKHSDAMMSLLREDKALTFEEQKALKHWQQSSQSLDTNGVKNIRFGDGIIVTSKKMPSDLVFKAIEMSKDVSVIAPASLGRDPASLASAIQSKDEPGFKREGDMEVDLASKTYDFEQIRATVEDNRSYIIQEGRGPAATKDFASYQPKPPTQARKENVDAVLKAGGSIEAQIKLIDDKGRFAVLKTIDGAERAAIDSYRERRILDAKAGMPRGRFLLVDGVAKSNRMAGEIEKQDRADGIVREDPREVVLFGGSTTLSVGQRVGATGSFRQEAVESGTGMRQAQFGEVESFQDNLNTKAEPSLYATIKLDIAPGEKQTYTTIPVMTPKDLKNGLKSSDAMMSLVREDKAFTYEEQKSPNHFTPSSQSLATKGVADTRFAEGTVVASPNLNSETVMRAVGKADGGVVLISTAKVGKDPASLTRTVEAADLQRDVKPKRDISVKEEKPSRNLRVIQGGVPDMVTQTENNNATSRFDEAKRSRQHNVR